MEGDSAFCVRRISVVCTQLFKLARPCLCKRVGALDKIDDRFPSAVRWFSDGSEIDAAAMGGIAGIKRGGIGPITALRGLCFLAGG